MKIHINILDDWGLLNTVIIFKAMVTLWILADTIMIQVSVVPNSGHSNTIHVYILSAH